RLELTNVELRGESLRVSGARHLERRLARAQRVLGDRALLIQLQELEVARRDVTDEGQHRRALTRLLGLEVRLSRVHATSDTSPEIELPREIAREPRGTIRRRRKRTERDLIRALGAVDAE